VSTGDLTPYQRLFGSGPAGFVLSLALLALAKVVARGLPGGELFDSAWPGRVAAFVFALGAVALAIYSASSLPPHRRGQGVCREGIYRWLRHPLYASFLLGSLGVALFMNHWIFLLWAALLHPLWHWMVRYEEGLMLETFGEAYADYARRTGRFVPRIW